MACWRALCLTALLAFGARAEEPGALLEAITVKTADKGVSVRVDFTARRDFKKTLLKEPYRVVYDFGDTRLRADVEKQREVGHRLLKSLRAGQFSAQPPVTRLVFEPADKQPIDVVRDKQDPRVLTFRLGTEMPTSKEPAPAAPKPVATQLTAAAWEKEDDNEANLVLNVSELPNSRGFALSAPERVVLDLDRTTLKAAPPAQSANGLVESVRLSQFTPDTVRVVVQLKRHAGFQVLRRLQPHRLILHLSAGQPGGQLIVLDPGHGGKDNGCTGFRAELYEKNVVLDIGLRTRKMLEAKGLRVEMTRADDTFIPLDDRPALANRLGAELFVSIHCNAMPDDKKGTRSGTELYYYTDVSPRFAQVMLEQVTQSAGLEARGTHQRRFVVVRGCQMPSVLVETGYLDTPTDGALLDSEAGRQQFAEGIAAGILRFIQERPALVAKAPATGEHKG